MPSQPLIYKFHFLDHRHHLTEVRELSFTDDALASESAFALQRSESHFAIEVMHGSRFICRVDGGGIQRTPSSFAEDRVA